MITPSYSNYNPIDPGTTPQIAPFKFNKEEKPLVETEPAQMAETSPEGRKELVTDFEMSPETLELSSLSLKELEHDIDREIAIGLKEDGISAEAAAKAEKAGNREVRRIQSNVKKLTTDRKEVNAFVDMTIQYKISALERGTSKEVLAEISEHLQRELKAAREQLNSLEIIENTSDPKGKYSVTLQLDGKPHVIKANSPEEAHRKAEEFIVKNAKKNLPKEVCKELNRESFERLSEELSEGADVGVGSPLDTFGRFSSAVQGYSIGGADLSVFGGGAGQASAGLSIALYGITANKAVKQYKRATLMRKQALELSQAGFPSHARIVNAAASKLERQATGMASLAGLGLCRGIAESAGGAIALAAIFTNVGSAAAVGAGVAAGGLGIAVGSFSAALNLRNMAKATMAKKDIKEVMHHLLTRHALLPGTEEEVILGLEICNMVKRKQNEKFFGNATNLSVNTLVIVGGATAIAATATGAASMGAVPAAVGATAAALAVARWYIIHQRSVEARDRQAWLAETGQNLSTDQGLYISLYFQLKSELQVRHQQQEAGITTPTSAIFCDEVCPLLGLDPEAFVHAVDGLASNFVEQMEGHRSSIVEGLALRQSAFEEGVPDPLLASRIHTLGQTSQLGGEYVPGGYKVYKSEQKIEGQIEKKRVALHKVRKSIHKETEKLFRKGKATAESKKMNALYTKEKKLTTDIKHKSEELETLKQSHRPHFLQKKDNTYFEAVG